MLNILFVDDDRAILDGLRRNLRSMRHEWSMAFAEGGAAGLEHLAANDVDVIVSDLRMPSMDGAEFLDRARRQSPDTLRIVLSGHADAELAARAARSAHRLLAKPCSSDHLKEAVTSGFALRQRFACPRLQQFAQGARLPAIPQLYNELCDVMGREDATFEDGAAVVANDVSMSAKVLQLVNSAFFGLGKQVDSIEQAVRLLGLDTLKSVVLNNELFDCAPPGLLDVVDLGKRSVQLCLIAKVLARKLGLDKATTDQTMTAAILHEIGILLFADIVGDDYVALLRSPSEAGLAADEHSRFGFTHQELGAYTLALWGISDPVVEAVCYHHEPHLVGGAVCRPLTVLYLASWLAGTLPPDRVDESFVESLDLPLSPETLRASIASLLEYED